MRQMARPDQLIERASRDMKQLGSFIGIEQGFGKRVRELPLVNLPLARLYSLHPTKTPTGNMLTAPRPSAGAASS
jgi:hypothetical protein